MEFLSEWLKSVVLVILIATFVDLLLPNRSMQRYVKTVMSLFLLMTLLQPLLTLLRPDSSIEERLTAALLRPEAVQVNGGMESLEAIRQRGQALQDRQQETANRLARQKAGELMKRQIEQNAQVSVRSVQVDTETDGQGQAVIRKVTVLAEAVKPQPAAVQRVYGGGVGSSVETMSPIEPMRPVEPPADVHIGSAAAAAGKPDKTAPKNDKDSPALLQTKTKIIHMLEQEWALREEQIELTIEPAPGR
ncbi:stage III sporulation protein AF [Paenibacillus filicis]|uniref:Stage III sporulation protein AF n=1 Tax=Paenibacillus filicis TaxID=669464 RepID=A0ABU9DX89_9BACL